MSAGARLWCLAVAVVGLAACDNRGAGPGPGPARSARQPPAVEAVEVRWGSFPLEERLSGSVRARNQTDIYADVTGTIEAVYAEADRRGTPAVYWLTQDFNEPARRLYDRVANLTPFVKYTR